MSNITCSKGDLREVSEGVAGGVGQGGRPGHQVVPQPCHHLDVSRTNLSKYNNGLLLSPRISRPRPRLPGQFWSSEVVPTSGEDTGEGVGGADAALSSVHVLRSCQDSGLRKCLEEREEALEGSQGGDDCLLSLTVGWQGDGSQDQDQDQGGSDGLHGGQANTDCHTRLATTVTPGSYQ